MKTRMRAADGPVAPEDGPGVERKSVVLQIKDVAKGEVEAVFSTFGVKDHDGDWTLPGAFEVGADVLVGSWGHGTVFGDPPVGKGVIRATAKDARLDGKFFLDTIEGREQFTTVKNVGAMQEWSYSYKVLETGEITEKLQQMGVRRVIKKAEVFEISPVMRGAGIRTRTVTAKDKALDPPEPTAEVIAAKAAADLETARVAAEKKAADDAAALEKANAERAAAEFKGRTAEAVEEFHRVQRTLRRLGVAAR